AELDASPRAVLRQHGIRRWTADRDARASSGPRLRLGEPLAERVRRYGEGPGRRLGVGVARLRAARPPAHQSVRGRSWPDHRGRHSDPGAGHVRACVPNRFRSERDRLYRCLPPQHRLGVDANALRGRGWGRGTAAPRPEGVRRPARCCGRGGQGHAGLGEPVQIIDARPRSYISRQQDIMDGAVWRDPERIDEWIGELSKSDPVVVFCAYGFHVGCKTAIALREAGFDAKYMKGGHSAWKAIGGPIKLYT